MSEERYRIKNDRYIHDGDCYFWSFKVCTCGLLHWLGPCPPVDQKWYLKEKAEHEQVIDSRIVASCQVETSSERTAQQESNKENNNSTKSEDKYGIPDHQLTLEQIRFTHTEPWIFDLCDKVKELEAKITAQEEEIERLRCAVRKVLDRWFIQNKDMNAPIMVELSEAFGTQGAE